MSDYLPIFTLRLDHNYYTESVCRAIQIRVTSSGKSLLRRRNLIFKQIKENEWCVIGDSASAGVDDDSDVLTLEMILVEPDFVYFTVWEDFNFKKAYHLELPLKVSEAETTQVTTVLDLERKPKADVLCTVNIKLSNLMFENARAKKSIINTLTFNVPKVYWEYVFCPRNGDLNRNLRIEETVGKIRFGEIKKARIQPFMDEVLHAVTELPILMNEHYRFSLSLIEVIRENPLMKRALIKQLPYPEIGKIVTTKSNVIRRICYY